MGFQHNSLLSLLDGALTLLNVYILKEILGVYTFWQFLE
jgi:hypothetical protein